MEKSLPSRYYTTPEIFAREWFSVGREEGLPAPSNHAVVDVANESILVVRTTSGQLKAHYNVCRHRGARLRS